MNPDEPGTPFNSRSVADLLAPLASAAVLGNAFVWIYMESFFQALGMPWLANDLSWSQRYHRCYQYLFLIVLSYLVAHFVFHSNTLGLAPRRRPTFLALLLLLLLSAGLFVLSITHEWTEVAERLARFGVVLLSSSLAWVVAKCLRDLGSGYRIHPSDVLLAGFLFWNVLFGAPIGLGYLAATQVYRNPSENLISVRSAARGECWFLILASPERIFIGHAASNGGFDSVTAVSPEDINLSPTDAPPAAQMFLGFWSDGRYFKTTASGARASQSRASTPPHVCNGSQDG
jgi:hypothetical protein